MPHLYYLSSNKAQVVEEQEDMWRFGYSLQCGRVAKPRHIFYFVL